MKPLAILVLAVALEAGFLLTAALPAPTLARLHAGARRAAVVTATRSRLRSPPARTGREVRHEVVAAARLTLPDAAARRP